MLPMNLLKIVALSLVLLSTSSFAMMKSQATSSSSSASSASSSTSSTSAKFEDFVIPAFADIMNAFEQSTPDTILDVIEKYSPVRILFEINHKLKYQKTKKAEFDSMFDGAVLSYVLLIKLTEMNVFQVTHTGGRFLSILENLKAKKFTPEKKDKKRFFEKNTTLVKIKNLVELDLKSVFTKDVQTKIDAVASKIKANLIASYQIQGVNPHDTLTQIYQKTQHKKFRDQICLFGCRVSYSEISDEFGKYAQRFGTAEGAKAMNVHYAHLLKYSELVTCRTNLSTYLAVNGQFEEAEKWAKIAAQEGSTIGITNLEGLRLNSKGSATSEVEFCFSTNELKKTAIEAETEINFKRAAEMIEKNNLVISKEALALLIGCAEKNHVEATKWLPTLLNIAKNPAAALHWAEIAVAKYNHVEAYLQAAKAALALERHEAALGYLRKYQGEKKYDYYLTMAECHFAVGRYDEAKLINDQITHVDSVDVLSQKFNICIATQDVDGAKEVFADMGRKINHIDDTYWMLQISLGTFLMSMGHYDEAAAYLTQSIARKPSGIALYHVGAYHALRGNVDLAYENLNKAMALESEIMQGARKYNHFIRYYLGWCHEKKGNLEEAAQCYVKSYKLGMKEASLQAARVFNKLGNLGAERYFKLAVADHIEGADIMYALFLDNQARQKEAKILLEQNSFEDDAKSQDDDGSEEDIIEEDEKIVAPAVSPVEQVQQAYVEVKDTKKYKRWLKEAQVKAEVLNQKPVSMPKAESAPTYADVNVTLASADLQAEIEAYEVRIKSLLSALAGRVKAGKFEGLKGFTKRFSMRITKADRLVFDIVDGGMEAKEGVKAIVIVSAKGHYKDMTDVEYSAPTGIKVKWSAEE